MAIKLNTGGTPQTFQQGASFSDQQKQELAKSVGFSGEFDPTMFNKELDPSTGQNKLYIKVGGNKIFGSAPVAKQAGVQEQASYMQQQFGNRSMDDIYSSILAARPSDTDIQVALGQQTGLSQQIAGARAQMDDIQRKMLGDQSAIFNATNPDGTPIDPRLKVAQYQQNMQSYMNRIDQLGKLEATYKAELQTLSEAEKSRIEQENKRNLTALQYLKDMNDQKRQEEESALKKQQFGFQREQFEYGKQKDIIDFNQAKELSQFNASLDPDKYTKWEEIKKTATENSSLADLYGKNVGTYEGNRGYDLAGKMGDAIVAPPGAKVIEVRKLNASGGVDVEAEGKGGMSMKDVGYGNSVLLQLPDGKYMRLSHLNSVDVPLGSQLAGGQLVGTRGNTGNVLGRNGEKLTAEQLAAGRGAHVDVEISNDSTFGKGSLLSQAEQLAYLKSVKPFATGKTQEGLSDSDIETFNNPTFKPADIKSKDVLARYGKFIQEKNRIKTDKNASIGDILKFSAGGKDLGTEEVKSLGKFDQALGQIGGIQEQINDMSTGPILGRLRAMNPYDTDAQVLSTQLMALIPNLARGVYGEVGVLTDQDIKNYAQTIPNLKSTEDVNKAVLAMTLDTIAGGYKKQLQTLAASGRDVSGFVGLYDQIKGQADYLKSEVQGGMQSTAPAIPQNRFTSQTGAGNSNRWQQSQAPNTMGGSAVPLNR